MVAFYAKKIEEGKLTLKHVPSKWHDAVAAEMKKRKGEVKRK